MQISNIYCHTDLQANIVIYDKNISNLLALY